MSDTVRIPLRGKYGNGKFVEIDKKNEPLVAGRSVWLTDKGRAKIHNCKSSKPKDVFLHREIVGLQYGDILVTDHIDGNPLNCTEENMRICTNSQNLQNARPKCGRTFKGAYRERETWIMMIMSGGRKYERRGFPTELDAALAYNEHAKRLNGDYAKLNDIPKSFVPSLPIEAYLPLNPLDTGAEAGTP
jgi:hypothetical protein